MKRALILGWLLLGSLFVAGGCGFSNMWRSIPPPGGCDRCHQLAINNNWSVTVSAVQLSGEDGKPPWQKEGSLAPAAQNRPLEQQMLEEERCFRCHREPEASHREYRGNYHHR